MTQKYTLLLNSTDSFSDCWEVFFALFKKYWPEPRPMIILNTETKTFSDPDLKIINAETQKHFGRRPTWSEGIKYCLELSPTPIVLYLQEDYFLERRVDAARLARAAQLMLDHQLTCVAVTDLGARGPYLEPPYPELLEVGANTRYKVNCQGSLWNATDLQQILRPEENAWQFEIFGTARERRSKRKYYALKSTPSMPDNAVAYLKGTAIIKGAWNPTVVGLLKANNLELDLEKRGFYEGIGVLENKWNTFRKLYNSPYGFLRGLFGV
jgi:hypothetical protein